MLAGQEINIFDVGISRALELKEPARTAEINKFLALKGEDAQQVLNALQVVSVVSSTSTDASSNNMILSGWTATNTMSIAGMPSTYFTTFPCTATEYPLLSFYRMSSSHQRTVH
jgi:hypothetical protein